jgi:hypothetical protein
MAAFLAPKDLASRGVFNPRTGALNRPQRNAETED